MPIIFITHTHADNPFVEKIAKRIEDYGYKVWVDLQNITPGQSIPGEIGSVFDQIDYQLIVISEVSSKSKWVKKELEMGINAEINDNRRRVIGLRLDKSKVPNLLSEKQYVNFQECFRKTTYRAFSYKENLCGYQYYWWES